MRQSTYILELLLGLFILFAAGNVHSADITLRLSGIAPAYQVGKHDSKNRFCYDGSCILRGEGVIHVNLNPEKQAGGITATFDGPDGKWKIQATEFKLIKTNVYLHGATGGEVDPELSPPVLPRLWTYVATWGPGKVWHNDELAWMGPTHLNGN